jgi:aspartoacylase
MRVRNVAIVGGTHGNEVTGVYLLERWKENLREIERESFDTTRVLANPEAVRRGVRYIDQDLNRSFPGGEPGDADSSSCEARRAAELYRLLGPGGNSHVDFIIDLHSATSNMGITLTLLNAHEYNLKAAAYVTRHLPHVNIYVIEGHGRAHPYLNALVATAVSIEVGPVPQGVLRHDKFEETNRVVGLILDYIHAINTGQDIECQSALEVYLHREAVSYPRGRNNEILGMVHDALEGHDFRILHRGDPIFYTLQGDTLTYDGDDGLYPIFINEAAYYGEGVAFVLTEKINIAV